MNPLLSDVRVVAPALPPRGFAELRRALPQDQVERLWQAGFPFYRTTFWYPLSRPPAHVFEHVVQALRPLAGPPASTVGAEWWFSVTHTNATPQWILPCHFDRADLSEKDPRRIRHPDRASVLFLDAVPYGELVITDQVLGEHGGVQPRQPQAMRFIRPRRNQYAVFPGQLYHGVIGRMWRPQREGRLRVTMAVNWWSQPPGADYMRDSCHGPQAFAPHE